MAGQRQKGECYRSCLRGSLRGLNYLLAIVGVLMTAYALFMYVQWSDAAPVPPVPSPEPSPSPSPSHHKHHHHAPSPTSFDGSDTAASAIHELVNDGQEWEDSNLLDDLAERAESVHDEPSGKGALAKYPWFIYVFGGAGAFVFITASVGILSADCAGCGVTCFLGLYHAFMVLLLLVQISVVCFYFFDNHWEHDLPKDTTGEYAKMRELVLDNLRVCEFAGLTTLGLQLLALLVSCSLYYAESRPSLQYHVLQQHDHESASQMSGPPTAAMRAPPGHGEAWRARMADRYSGGGGGGGNGGGGGGNGGELAYDPEGGRSQARGEEEEGEPRRRNCSVM